MRPLLLPLALPLALLVLHCGGGGSGGTEPKSAASATSDGDEAGDDSQTASDDDDAPSAAAEKSKGPSCDDGTCSLCGSGICPTGWYCDEGASGGAACSWLTECADKPSCGCITRVLGSSCKCREDGGGLKVSCG